jgi:hypothetical protein
MKEVFSDTLLTIVLIALMLTGGFLAFKNFAPQGPAVSQETEQGEQLEPGQYASKDSELTVRLPAEFKVAVARGVNEYENLIFAATSSEDLMTIRKMAIDENVVGQEVIDEMYRIIESVKKDEVGGAIITWDNVAREVVGEHEYIFHSGVRRHMEGNLEIIEEVNQYITYHPSAVYFVDFITFYKSKPALWKGIVAGIDFK